MEKAITVRCPEDKYRALDHYLTKKGSTLEKEMEAALQSLYDKTVPISVREFLDATSDKPRKERKENARNQNPGSGSLE